MAFIVFASLSAAKARAEDVSGAYSAARLKLNAATDPVERALQANKCMQLLLARTATAKYATREELSADIDSLRSCTIVLIELDQPIRKEMGQGARDEQRIFDSERYIASGWLNGWATLGHLARSVARVESSKALGTKDNLYRRLLSLDREIPGSGLSLLLDLHQQLVVRTERFKEQLAAVRLSAEKYAPPSAQAYAQRLAKWVDFSKGTDDPIQVRLYNAVDLSTILGTWWVRAEARQHGRFYLPATSQIVGSDDDDVFQMRAPYSLWALVNLQLDSWNSWNNATEPITDPQLNDAAEWLRALSNRNDPRLVAIDPSESMQQRVRKLSLFLAFRQKASDERWLGQLVAKIAADRTHEHQQGPAAIDRDLASLIEAARPLENSQHEFLADAAVWLRYVLLLSYQGDGGLVLVGNGENSIDRQWSKWNLPQNGFALPLTNERKVGVLRWHGFPAAGHSTRCLQTLCNASYAYLRFGADVKKLEQNRSNLAEYSSALRDRMESLESALAGFLPPNERQMGRERATWISAPLWSASNTGPEQQRLLNDREAIVARIDRSLRFQTLLLTTIEQRTNAQATSFLPAPPRSAISSLGGATLLYECDLHLPPDRPFDEYARAIRRIAEQINKAAADQRESDLLIRKYQTKQWDVSIERIEHDATLAAITAAEHALRMAEIFDRMSELDKQIANWRYQAAEQERKAADDGRRAASIRLELAVRGRDLAAAQLAALQQAYEQAPQVIEQSVHSLEGMQRQLMENADKLEEQRRRSFIMGLIKSVVRIVSVALAPFTGGASVGIGQAVASAVDMIDEIDRMDWSDLGNVVNNAGRIVQRGDSIVTPVLRVTGGIEDWDKFKSQLTRFKDNSQGQLRGLEADAKAFIQNLRGLDEIVTATSAAASALPVRLDGTDVVIDLNQLPQIEVVDPGLKDALRDVLRSGCVFVNSLEARAAGLNALPSLKDDELKHVLESEFDNIVRIAPPEVLERIREIGVQGEDALNQARDRLKAVLNDDAQGGVVRRRLLAKLLGSGMVVVTNDQGKVVAITRDVKPELAEFRKHLEHVRKEVYEGAIQSLISEVSALQQGLQRRAEAAGEDPAKLRELAAEISKPNGGTIAQVRGKLDSLASKVSSAVESLQNSKLTMEASELDAAAAQFKVLATEYHWEAAGKETERSMLAVQFASEQLSRDRELLRQRTLQETAQTHRIELAELELRFAYEDCTNQGVDPVSQISVPTAIASLSRVLTRGVGGSKPEYRAGLQEACANFAGMLRWQSLLKLKVSPPPGWSRKDQSEIAAEDLYLEMLAMGDDSSNYVAQLDVIAAWASHLDRELTERAGQRADFTGGTPEFRGSDVDELNVHFFSGADQCHDEWTITHPDDALSMVGRVEIVVPDHYLPERQPDKWRLLVVGRELAVVTIGRQGKPAFYRGSLRYKILPPNPARPNRKSDHTSASWPDLDWPVRPDSNAAAWFDDVKERVVNWHEDLLLTGINGTWRIYLFDTRLDSVRDKFQNRIPGTAGEWARLNSVRQKIASDYEEALGLRVLMPYIRIAQ